MPTDSNRQQKKQQSKPELPKILIKIILLLQEHNKMPVEKKMNPQIYFRMKVYTCGEKELKKKIESISALVLGFLHYQQGHSTT